MAEPVSGIDVLRRTAKARNKTPNALNPIASEIKGLGAGTLEAFANNKAELTVEQLQKLTEVLHPNGASYDAQSGMLRWAAQTPQRLPDLPRVATPNPNYLVAGYVPHKGKPAAPKPKRPGWLNSWL